MELAISIISLVTAVIALLTSILPSTISMRRNVTGFCNKYDEFKANVAAALTMYACYYYNPVDLAKTEGHTFPQKYDTAIDELKKLGATASALAAIIPTKKKNLPITKEALSVVSGCLIGLSNSMHTPYNCAFTSEDRRNVEGYELEIRTKLQLEDKK